MKCFICGIDDGLTIMCGRHWSEYVRWCRAQEDGDTDAGVAH